MSKKIWVVVPRSGPGAMTDKTPGIRWEHELALLKEAHGTDPEVIEDLDQLLDASVKVATDPSGKKIGREELLARRIAELGLGATFAGDPFEEYGRLERIYGIHPEVKMPIVTYVYGRFEEGRFARALNVEALEDMTMPQIRSRCTDLGIEWTPKDKKADLIVAIRAATSESALAHELSERHERRMN